MFPIRVKTVQESDLRMLGSLARNIQRVLPVTQADIDAAAALGKGWVVWKVFEVSDPLDNMRGGTQLIIRQNSVQPGQNVRRVIFVSGPGGQTVIIRGADYIVLPDAIANSLSYVKAFGGTEQSGTPTPNAPVDIVSNNGVLKVKDSELPLGYKRLLGITYDSDTYYETNQKLYGSDTLTIQLSGTVSSGRNVIGAYSGLGDDARNFSLYVIGGGSSSASYLRHGTQLARPRYGSGTKTLVMGPTGTDGFLNDVTYEEETFETTDTFWIGALPKSTSTKYDGNILGNITVSDRLKYIPCERESDGAIGYYEKFTGVFLENQGTGTPVSMGYDASYMTEVYADGTVETINVHGKNLIDVADFSIPNNSSSSTLWTGSMTGTFRLSVDKSQVTSVGGPASRFLILVIDGNTSYVNYNATDSVAINGTLTSIRCYNSSAYARVAGKISLQLERGTTTTAYEPYYDGGTATAEMLLKVGDYQDEQEILSGAVTRKCGAVILDSSLEWTYDSNYGRVNATIPNLYGSTVARTVPGFCTHFEWLSHQESISSITAGQCYSAGANRIFLHISQTSAATFSAWLDAQKDAGTPVIIVFPLENATTESVAGQTLQVQAGDNVLEITQASLTGLELEAQYNAAVQLTIQEVQDANLDPNVQVTIN